MMERFVLYIANYITFFWGVAWRTFVVSIVAAMFSGVALAYVAGSEGWPPAQFEFMASAIGLPITLLVAAYVVWKQAVKVIRRQPVTVSG